MASAEKLPDLIKGTVAQYGNPTAKLIKKFFHEYELAKPTRNYKSLLYLGCNNGMFFVQMVLPHIPDNITDIVACDISAERIKFAVDRYKVEVTERVTFISYDILYDTTELGLYDCVMSVRCVRLLFPGHHVYKFMDFINANGCGCLIYDVNEYLHDTIRLLSSSDVNADLLFGKERRIPDYTLNKKGQSLTPPHILTALSPVRRISLSHEICKMIFRNARELQDQMEVQFSITEELDSNDRDRFYEGFFDKLIQHRNVKQTHDVLGVPKYELYVTIQCIGFLKFESQRKVNRYTRETYK